MSEQQLKILAGLLLAALLIVLAALGIKPGEAVPVGGGTEVPLPTVIAPPSVTPVPVVVKNGDFEAWWDSQGRPWDWIAVQEGCGDYQAHFEADLHGANVHGGLIAGRVWQDYRTCRMALVNFVDVTPGTVYQVNAWGLSRSHDGVGNEVDSFIQMWLCVSQGKAAKGLVIDTTLCSAQQGTMGAYRVYSVDVVATDSVLTLWLVSKPNWGMARSDTWWDDVTISIGGQ